MKTGRLEGRGDLQSPPDLLLVTIEKCPSKFVN